MIRASGCLALLAAFLLLPLAESPAAETSPVAESPAA
jgi:hypothetical protein